MSKITIMNENFVIKENINEHSLIISWNESNNRKN